MRSFVFAVLLAGACAHSSTGPNEPVNVAVVRNDIKAEIVAENDGRTIQSMGRVRHDNAVVYTKTANGERLEETWAKVDGRWKLQTKTALK
jgi:hypothetical protein